MSKKKRRNILFVTWSIASKMIFNFIALEQGCRRPEDDITEICLAGRFGV
jgi:hypothetical protein